MSKTSDFIVDLLAKWKVELTPEQIEAWGEAPLYGEDGHDPTLLNVIGRVVESWIGEHQYQAPPGLGWSKEFECIKDCSDKACSCTEVSYFGDKIHQVLILEKNYLDYLHAGGTLDREAWARTLYLPTWLSLASMERE